MRGIVQLIPLSIGSCVDVAITTQLDNIMEDRAKTFFDELGNGSVELTKSLIETEEFLHKYFSTVKAALNTIRREKIVYFARLLKSSIIIGNSRNIDEYEEYLSILDELSYRELGILIRLYHFENLHPNAEGENELQRTAKFWDEFCKTIMNEFDIEEDEINSVLVRLKRTGCYMSLIGYWDDEGNKGKTTATFKRLIKMIGEKSTNRLHHR